MELECRETDGVLVVKPLVSRLDAAVAVPFKEQVKSWIDEGRRRFVLDLSQVTFVDSSGLGAIVSIHKKLRNDGKLVVCGLTGNVMNLFDMTRVDRIIPIFSTVEEAVDAATD